MPTPRETFPVMYEIWFFQFNLLSIIIPRNFVFSTSSIFSPSIINCNLNLPTRRFEKTIKGVFLTFKDNLFVFNHFEIFASSWLIFVSNASKSEPLQNKFVSSANSIGAVYLQTSHRSLMYIRKRSGPKIDPWGTPQMMFLVAEDVPF